MFMKQKKGRPYMNLAIFSLAAAGVVTLAHKTKKFVKEKSTAISDFLKR